MFKARDHKHGALERENAELAQMYADLQGKYAALAAECDKLREQLRQERESNSQSYKELLDEWQNGTKEAQ